MKDITKEELIPGKEYYMECLTYDKNKNMVCCNPPYKMIAKFEKLALLYGGFSDYQFPHFSNFRKVYYKNNKTAGYNVYLNTFWRFYEIAEDAAQLEMEKRAYNLVLLEIIKDEYFKLEILGEPATDFVVCEITPPLP